MTGIPSDSIEKAVNRINNFHVSSNDIPDKMTIYLSETEKCIFARLLTKFGISPDVAGDTYHHLYKKGLEKVYEQHNSEKLIRTVK
jgi:hypothetical protein